MEKQCGKTWEGDAPRVLRSHETQTSIDCGAGAVTPDTGSRQTDPTKGSQSICCRKTNSTAEADSLRQVETRPRPSGRAVPTQHAPQIAPLPSPRSLPQVRLLQHQTVPYRPTTDACASDKPRQNRSRKAVRPARLHSRSLVTSTFHCDTDEMSWELVSSVMVVVCCFVCFYVVVIINPHQRIFFPLIFL